MKIHSIFESISGEIGVNIPQGTWCTFIRLQGCNLRCKYCDTQVTQNAVGGKEMNVNEIMKHVVNQHVIITGGEPLLDKDAFVELADALLTAGHIVQVETNGTKIPYVFSHARDISYVIDYKGPSSGMDKVMPNAEQFILNIVGNDVIIKFVIADDQDFYFATNKIGELYDTGYRGYFALSPIDGNPQEVQKMVSSLRFFLDQRLLDKIIFSLQIHKICSLA